MSEAPKLPEGTALADCPLADKLPSRVRIGPHDIRVSRIAITAAAGMNEHGNFSNWDKRIEVCSGVCLSDVVDTFLHEALHAMFRINKLTDEDGEERTVAVLATALTQFYRDNPRLGEWLSNAGKEMAQQ